MPNENTRAGSTPSEPEPPRAHTSSVLAAEAAAAEVAPDDPGNPWIGSAEPRDHPSGSMVVEVQFRSSATVLAAALATDAEGFLGGTVEGADAPGGAAIQAVLRDHRLQGSGFSFADRYIREDSERLAARAAAGTLGSDPLAALPSLQSFVRLRFPSAEDAAAAARELGGLAEVETAVVLPGAAPPELLPPTDPLIGTPEQGVTPAPGSQYQPQWYLHRMRVPHAWAFGTRGAGVVIADIDWGFLVTHQDLAPRLELQNAYNAYSKQGTVSGGRPRHGTAVLGLAGAAANGRGIVGCAPEASLWAIQGDSSTGDTSDAAWQDAIEHVRGTVGDKRRKVIILEVQTFPKCGNYEQIPAVSLAIQRAIASGIVVCIAAGNGDWPVDLADDGKRQLSPTGSILVGATVWDPNPEVNRRASFSNYGPRVVVSAPGDLNYDVTCGHTTDDKYYNQFGGTSSAVAKVAGVAALMLSINPALTHDDVREIMRGTGRAITPHPATPEKPVGVFLDAEAAVAEALRRAEGHAAAPQGLFRVEGLGRHAPPPRRPLTGSAPSAEPRTVPDRSLREFRGSTDGVMTREQQRLAVEQAIHLLELFYVHRPLKESMHGVRPVQRLRVLLRRLEEEPGPWLGRHELRFHKLLSDVFTSMRDLHTCYQLPRPYRDYSAYLPFLVRPYCDDQGRDRYLVTRVVPKATFDHPDFGPGCEILVWNGVRIEAAVEQSAEQTAGSNAAARYVRGVDALTVRPMNVAAPPDADCVYLTFRRDQGEVQEMCQEWLVRFTPLETDWSTMPRTAVERLFGGDGPLAVARDDDPVSAEAAPPAALPEAAFSLEAPGAHNVADEVLFSTGEPPTVSAVRASPASPGRGLLEPAVLEYRASLGIDVAADSVREAKELLFTPERATAARERTRSGVPDALRLDKEDVPTHLPLVFYARRLGIAGQDRGYIRIRTFAVSKPDVFVQEFIRLLQLLPPDGLILDVRGNGGGNIMAAERLLQTLTAGPIEPQRLQFISTPGTLELCRRNETLSVWTDSLAQAVLTGSVYSQALPVTPADSCNQIGQCYHGPVVLLVDARCYSATDIFAAGFEDHQIGPIIGTSATTGAGGANVWDHDLLHLRYSGDGTPLRPLPHGMGMRVALRQSLRVGLRAGTLLEDFGVSPKSDLIHRTTRRDLLDYDADLLEFASRVVGKLPLYRLALEETERQDRVQFRVDFAGITRLDFYLDGHPAASLTLTAETPPPTFSVVPGKQLELRGFVVGSDSPSARWVATLRRLVS